MRRALSDAHPRVFDCKKESVCSLDPERLFSDGQDAVKEHFGRERFLFRQVSGSFRALPLSICSVLYWLPDLRLREVGLLSCFSAYPQNSVRKDAQLICVNLRELGSIRLRLGI